VSAGPGSVRVRVEIADDDAEVARRGAAEIGEAARAAVAERGSFAIAVSGGRTPWAMFAALVEEDIPWSSVGIWQVDERVAPRGDDDRGRTHLEASLPVAAQARLHPIPVDDVSPGEEEGLAAAAAAYGRTLPPRFDLIHLGLGADGHTASLVPGDAAVEARDRDVAVAGTYQGRRRITVTLPVLDRARRILWIVTGSDKARALALLLARDPSIPASLVAAPDQLAIVDRSASAGPVA
jgi:6-phosphogluconolactonase